MGATLHATSQIINFPVSTPKILAVIVATEQFFVYVFSVFILVE